MLSTLHTNDAPSAITRLVDMGIEPYLLSSSIVGVLAQRLVRRICPECKQLLCAHSTANLQSIGLQRNDLKNGMLYHGEGCNVCFGSGYKGRHGVYEMMVVNNAIKKQIVKSPDAVELRHIALRKWHDNLLTMEATRRQGITTVAEVLRVTRGMEEKI